LLYGGSGKQGIEPEQVILDGWSRSQKLSDGGAGAGNCGSGSTDIACGGRELYK